MSLIVFTDADHAGCKVTRKSTSGLCVFLGCNLLVLASKKQSVVARSVEEAKYRAVAQGVNRNFMVEVLVVRAGVSS